MMAFTSLAKTSFILFTLFQLSLFVNAGTVNNGMAKRAPVNEAALLTNAARFQAGLGPMRPRSLYARAPSRVDVRSPATSAVPLIGHIEVRNSGGLTMGFVSSTIGEKGFGLASSKADKMSVTFTPNGPFDIAINGGTFPKLGFNGGDLVSPVDNNKNFLVGTNPTPLGSKSVAVGNSHNGKSESAIWFYNHKTHELTAQWKNADGLFPPSRFWYYPAKHALGLVNANPPNSNAGQEVFFFLVQLPFHARGPLAHLHGANVPRHTLASVKQAPKP